MALPSMHLGQRYAVRLAAVSPTGESAARDVVGTLVAADATTWTLLPDDRGPERVQVTRVVAARSVPPRVVRPTSSIDDLQRLAARGWPGLEQQRLGGWRVRLGGGHTKRANSVLVAGAPGCAVDEAIDAVVDTYLGHGLRPTAQLSYPLDAPVDPAGEVDALLAARGWLVVEPSLTCVADLRQLSPAPPPDEVTASWADEPGDGWPATHPLAHEVMTAAPARYLTLHRGGTPVARARLALVDDWVGVSDLVVEPDVRGQGLGRAAMHEVVAEGLREGARFGYLQVVQANAVALRLYDSLGWRRHHRYHYRVAPTP